MVRSRAHRGFTLVEMVVVIALVGIIGSLTAFSDLGAYKRVLASTDADTIASALVQARNDAMHGVCFDSSCDAPPTHGVYMAKNHLVIFEGPSYNDRLVAVDEELTLEGIENSSSDQEVVFAPVTGEPAQATALVFINSAGAAWRVDVAQNGLITENVVNSSE